MKRFLSLLLVMLTIAVVLSASAEARQYATPNGQVVHTRRAPVVMHRLVPPFRGVHQYGGRRR
jgi:hypothetical protein